MSTGQDHDIRSELRNLKVLQGPFIEWDAAAFPSTPQEAFGTWLNEAVKAGVKEPHAMTLSTVDGQGLPDARVLILKNVDHRGWHFAIKADSPKGQQLASSGHAALTFYWPDQGRQVRIRGKAIQLPAEECERDFAERPVSSKITALGSKQSQKLRNEAELKRSMDAAKETFEKDPDFVVTGWKVFAVDPSAVEFWQGASSRLHKRMQYTRTTEGGAWERNLLWP